MGKFILHFNSIVLIVLLLSSCSSNATTLPFSYYENYCIIDSHDNKVDKKWTDYLDRHLSKRCLSPTLVSRNFTNSNNNVKISVHVDETMKYDYKVVRERESIELNAKNKDIMLWLIYQFIAGVAQDDGRFSAVDIPPAVIDIKSQESNYAFELRSIYSPTNSNEEMLSIRGTNHVDYDWALWGHNLWKVVGDNANENLFAEVEGKRNHEQYCFSSPELFSIIDSWIMDNYGKGNAEGGNNFTIMPQDNSIVCMCEKCRKSGNTYGNATPAVTNLLLQLAKKYPHHRFFTSAYLTTAKPPKVQLPSNVGVFISAIDIPMKYAFAESKGAQSFDTILNTWKTVCSKIYVWEYMQNYDDYLTPYPCLSILQKRLQYYKRVGVSGIFFNGSGQNYSSFDDLHTYVLSALLVDPDVEVEKLINRFYKYSYPVSAQLLADYYISLEKYVVDSKSELMFYGDIKDATTKYLEPKAFQKFWIALNKASKKASGEERRNLNYLLTALSFTRMEMLRLDPETVTPADKENILEVLNGYKDIPEMQSYREANGLMTDYLSQWKDQSLLIAEGDQLKGVPVSSNNLGEDAIPVSCLTDGRIGFSTDYHLNWLISGVKEWKLNIGKVKRTNGKFIISILFAPKWRMWFPEFVGVSQNGKMIGELNLTSPTDSMNIFKREEIQLSVNNFDLNAPVEIIMRKDSSKARSTIACDEVSFY